MLEKSSVPSRRRVTWKDFSSTNDYELVRETSYHDTLFRNESITNINYPELLTAFYHYIIYMHIKKVYNN
jgi:hypothetical protein